LFKEFRIKLEFKGLEEMGLCIGDTRQDVDKEIALLKTKTKNLK
jgi:hypothetical protein